jgi:enoyl-CoA hydratase/carnithine racemase
MTNEILLSIADNVAVLTLNRPERLNAWTANMDHEYSEALQAVSVDPQVRAVILTGAGRGFCAGADMGRLTDRTKVGAPKFVSNDLDLEPAVPKPMIAAINGACAGVGTVRALYCDVRFVARSAPISMGFARRGLAAERGMAWLLPRVVGWSRALELMMSGRTIDGTEAAEIGLAFRAVEDPLAEAIAYGIQIAQLCAPLSLRDIKSQVWDDANGTLAESLAHADTVMNASFARPDLVEAIASFTEKRSPRFTPLTTYRE